MYESATSVTLANNSRNQGKVGELAWDSGQPHKRLIDCGLSAARRLRGQLRRPVGVSAAEWPGCLGNVQLTLRTVNMLMRSQHPHAHMQDKLREWKGSYKHASYSVVNVKTHMRIHTSTLGHNEWISTRTTWNTPTKHCVAVYNTDARVRVESLALGGRASPLWYGFPR